jgi:ankyrin repeat protein
MKYLKKFEYNYATLNDAIYDCEDRLILKLIEDGYDVNETDDIGRTPLIWCAIEREVSVDVTKKLIEKGAKLDVQDKYGCTALIKAADIRNYPVLYALLDAGADWSYRENWPHHPDFFYYLTSDDKRKVINKYPEKYQKYLMKKDAEKYNL